ncbi:MAG TPA: hypothetical protein DCY94_04395, partial [Firmicutes bacterium]|nr:hypothetical protein [Bacillota bacterium]
MLILKKMEKNLKIFWKKLFSMYDNQFKLVEHFYIIIYARLSKEEKGKSAKEQSKSIKNQVEVCKRYIEEEKVRFSDCIFEVIATLTDDGISGTTFNREDFKELVRLIEDKRANMVITTDLSRLGRNHVRTDDYIEEWFPEHNVRYVSIVEGVDTYTDCMSNDIAPIINWSNEHFAKLTSKKIKGRFNILRMDGKWTGGEVPLGYKIDANLKYHFVIDEKGAEVVKRIFKLFIETHSSTRVADILTSEKVPIPSVLKRTKRNLNGEVVELWKPETIKEILSNEMYLGHMVQGKTTRLNHKSKRVVYLPKENWVVVKNMHEPIISEPDFAIVQSLLKVHRNENEKSFDYSLRGLLKCKECGRSIGVQHYKNRVNNYTVCNYYRKYGKRKKVCTAHRFIYEQVEKYVLKNVSDCLKLLDYRHLEKRLELKAKRFNSRDLYDEKINKCQKEISKLEREIDAIYEDKLSGIID